MQTKLYFIVNRQASGYDNRLEALIKESFGDADYKLAFSEQAGDAARLVSELAGQIQQSKGDQQSVIVACGGDGLVCEILTAVGQNQIGDIKIPVMIIPIGTANILAAEVGASSGLNESIAKLKKFLKGESLPEKSLDLARVNGKYFVLRLNVGLFAETTSENNPELKQRWGRLSYLVTFWQRINTGKGFRVKLTIKTKSGKLKSRKYNCRSLSVTNAGSIGLAGLPLNQMIRADDGLLDLIIFRRLWLIDLINWGLSILLRQRTPLRVSKHYQCQSVQIQLKSPAQVVVDDTLVTGNLFDIEMTYHAASIIG